MRARGVIFILSMLICVLSMPASAMAVSATATKAPAATATAKKAPPPTATSADPGSNLASWLKSWVGALFSVVVGVVGLGAVAKRSVGEGLALLLVALIVGGFVIAPDSMNTLTQSVWTKVAG